MNTGKSECRRDQLRSIRHVALDMDGTIYKGGTLFEYTCDFLKKLTDLGIGYSFLTNNSSKSRKDYLLHLARMGIESNEEQMYTSTLSTIDCLRNEFPSVRRLFVLGTESLQTEFSDFGFEVLPEEEEPDAVIVGFDTALVYPRLCKAAWWIQQGKPFIATHPDLVCPTDQPTVLVDCGAVCACLESATGISPTTVLGKPDPRMLSGILSRHSLRPEELAMVGDRLYTDMAMARRAGVFGVLALSGEATAEDVAVSPDQPDLVVKNIEELGERLTVAKQGKLDS